MAAAPLKAKKIAEPKKVSNPLFEKRPKNFGIGKFVKIRDFLSIHFYKFRASKDNLNSLLSTLPFCTVATDIWVLYEWFLDKYLEL